MKYNKILAVLMCLALPLILGGCMKARELKQRTIIEVVGVDKKEDEYVLTMQKFSPKAQGSAAEVSGGAEKSTTVQTTGRSISEAVEKVTHYHGNEVFLGNSSVIILGKDAVEKDLENVLSFFNNNHEISPQIPVVMAENSAEELVNAQSQQGKGSTTQMKNIMQHGTKNGILGLSTLRDIMNRLQSEKSDPYLSVLRLVENGEGQNQIKLVGMGVFRDGSLKDQIGINEARGVLWATDEVEHAIITVPFGEKKDTQESAMASVDILRSTSKINVELEKGKPVIYLKIRTEGGMREVTFPKGGGASIEEIAEIEYQAEEAILKIVAGSIDRIFFEDKCDVFRYSEFLRKDQPEYWKANQDRWPEMIDDCKVVYDIDCNIDRPGLEIKHKQKENNNQKKLNQ